MNAIVDFHLDEDSFLGSLLNELPDPSAFNSAISVAEKIENTAFCRLLITCGFYDASIDGLPVWQRIFEMHGEAGIRDAMTRLMTLYDRSQTFNEFEHRPPQGISAVIEKGVGSLVTIRDQIKVPGWDSQKMHVVRDSASLRECLRNVFVLEHFSERDFPMFCDIMFDNIYFHTPSDKISQLGLSFSTSITDIINHLSYLNDFAPEDFSGDLENHEIIARAGNLKVDLSPESPQTRRNGKAMAERTIKVAETEICCEWHTKITPTRGRIHFYAWRNRHAKVREQVGEKTIIGIFAAHLI